MTDFTQIMQNSKPEIFPVMDLDLQHSPYITFDLTNQNKRLDAIDLNDEHSFMDFVFRRLEEEQVTFGIGRYLEDRTFYKRSEVFSGNRSVHLGIDIWAHAGEPVNAVMPGRVHSFKNNAAHGDYGPTIILQHEWGGISFYTLYGHLNTECLENLEEGNKIAGGEQIARLGTYAENVHWPPHLHFQVILEMKEGKGDYPGVCRPEDTDYYRSVCPDPNILLQIPGL